MAEGDTIGVGFCMSCDWTPAPDTGRIFKRRIRDGLRNPWEAPRRFPTFVDQGSVDRDVESVAIGPRTGWVSSVYFPTVRFDVNG